MERDGRRMVSSGYPLHHKSESLPITYYAEQQMQADFDCLAVPAVLIVTVLAVVCLNRRLLSHCCRCLPDDANNATAKKNFISLGMAKSHGIGIASS